MPSRRTVHRRRSCVGKITFRSQTLAQDAVDTYYTDIISFMEPLLEAYRCSFGKHWHIGHASVTYLNQLRVATQIAQIIQLWHKHTWN